MQPLFYFSDANDLAWNPLVLEDGRTIQGVELKTLCSANGNTMELYRFEPNITYPDHYHEGPEFVYVLEGSIRQDGKWMTLGWASAAETGTLDHNAMSGENGCVLLTVYKKSNYIQPSS